MLFLPKCEAFAACVRAFVCVCVTNYVVFDTKLVGVATQDMILATKCALFATDLIFHHKVSNVCQKVCDSATKY